MGNWENIGTVFKNTVSTGLLIASVVLTIQLISLARQNQEAKIDLAEVNHIKYGLLNADEWREQVTLIISKKIIEFDLTPENREELHKSLEIIMYGLLNDLEVVVEERTSGEFAAMKKWIAGMILDVDQLRDSVPSYASQVLDELNKPDTKRGIQTYLSDKLGDLSDITYSMDSTGIMDDLLIKYECPGKRECKELLHTIIDETTKAINLRVILILLSVLLIFLINTLSNGPLNRYQSPLLILSSFSLLVGGISTPMIDLEARIDRLVFQLIGEEVVFRDNIIFFQSKSITDIVELLVREGSLDMIFVGVLIFTFSIVFPLTKLISSYIYSRNRQVIDNNRMIRFFVIKSGKWSMADVMVVAIFMAYIGFDGIVGSQLASLRESAETVEIFTTNGTELLGGFYLFLSFCLSSLVLSEILNKRVD
ncbi:MAG: paraquat-inducible protein A [Bacteroidota bacterium]